MSEITAEEKQRMIEVAGAPNPMTEHKLTAQERIAARNAEALEKKNAPKTEAERQRKCRANKKLIKESLGCTTIEAFHDLQRKTLPTDKLADLQWQQEAVEDVLEFMRTGCDVSPDDEYFVGLHEGLAMIEAFIETRGFIRDSTKFNDIDLVSFQPGWSLWDKYWTDWRLEALCAENEPTKVFALYGIRIGLSEYQYQQWRGEISPQHAAFGCKNPECFLCRFRKTDPDGVEKLASTVITRGKAWPPTRLGANLVGCGLIDYADGEPVVNPGATQEMLQAATDEFLRKAKV
jgi:hypothetical protein